MSCLIIKNDGIGDLILASGLISAVGKHFDGNVDLVTCAANQEIAEGIEPLRNRYYVSRDGLRFMRKASKFGVLIPYIPKEDQPVIRAIQIESYDTVICLRRFIRQSSLVIMDKVGGDKKFCAWEFPTNATRSMAERVTKSWEHKIGLAEVLSELGYNKDFLQSSLDATFSAEPHLSFCGKQTSFPSTRLIALGLGGGSANWAFGNWTELAMRLSADGWRLLLLGGDDVADLAEQIALEVPDIDNRVGQLTWRQTSELLFECEGYIGNDTGLSHFASLILHKCLVVLGGGTFRRFLPWPGSDNQYVIYHGLDCFDCDWDCKYRERICLSLVRPDDVSSYFKEIVNGNAEKERDLNPVNMTYQLCWRRKPGSGDVHVRLTSMCPKGYPAIETIV